MLARDSGSLNVRSSRRRTTSFSEMATTVKSRMRSPTLTTDDRPPDFNDRHANTPTDDTRHGDTIEGL